MAGVKFPKGSKEWCMFQDYWQICQRLYVPEDNEDYWKSVVKESGDFNKKYKMPFATSLILAFVNELERKHKETKKNETKN